MSCSKLLSDPIIQAVYKGNVASLSRSYAITPRVAIMRAGNVLPDSKNTVLHLAAHLGHLNVVKWLVRETNALINQYGEV